MINQEMIEENLQLALDTIANKGVLGAAGQGAASLESEIQAHLKFAQNGEY